MTEERPKMKCGHDYKDYELGKEDDIAYIRRFCVEGCETEWVAIGECPAPEEMKMREY